MSNTTTCTICGTDTTVDLPAHDIAVHEVYAFNTWGMHSVQQVARPYVESWANGTHRLPTREEWLAKFPVVEGETPVERQDRLARDYGVQESGMAVGHEYHSSVSYDNEMSLREVQAKGGKITRVRILQEMGRCDISYIHATLRDGTVVPVRLDLPAGSTCLNRRTLKADFLEWAREQAAFAKGLGLLDDANWSVLYG